MSKRTHNVMFHLHTVSGIVISVALYIIFFAGSFSFFRDEFINWERNEAGAVKQGMAIDFDKALDKIAKDYDLYGRDITIDKIYDERRVSISLTASKDTKLQESTSAFFYLDPKDFSTHTYVESYTLGEFLYRLHFFAQIYPVGYYLSGFVALFFLFAIITGLVIHWDKMVTNFFIFRPWAKLKTLWTDAHTALGTIGLPFQFIYAVTGAFFMLKTLLVAPSVFLLYDGDQAQLYEDLEYKETPRHFQGKTLGFIPNIGEYVSRTQDQFEDFYVTNVHIPNYGDAGMHVVVTGEQGYNTRFVGVGKIDYEVASQEFSVVKNPYQGTAYLDGVKHTLFRLHYGDYAGYALKIVSFILGIISCIVILSGVMVWLTARNKKNVPDKKRRFYQGTANIFMAICLPMYPVTALTFIVVRILGSSGQAFLYWFYFLSWLVLIVFFALRRNINFTKTYSLLLGSILGLTVPLVNGIQTGNWFWTTYTSATMDFFVVDVFWIFLGGITFWISLRLISRA